jgi:hypothetical protein
MTANRKMGQKIMSKRLPNAQILPLCIWPCQAMMYSGQSHYLEGAATSPDIYANPTAKCLGVFEICTTETVEVVEETSSLLC